MNKYMSIFSAGLAGSLITLGSYKALDLDRKEVVFQKADDYSLYRANCKSAHSSRTRLFCSGRKSNARRGEH